MSRGAAECAARLSRACGAAWRPETVTAVEDAGEYLENLLGDVFEDHFGSLIAIPGAVFLVVFDRESALKLSMRYARDVSDTLSASVQDVESTVMAEISNILVDPLADGIVAAAGEAAIPSAPEPLIESVRDLLTTALKRFAALDDLAITYYLRLSCRSLPARCAVIALVGYKLAGKTPGR